MVTSLKISNNVDIHDAKASSNITGGKNYEFRKLRISLTMTYYQSDFFGSPFRLIYAVINLISMSIKKIPFIAYIVSAHETGD